jgi:hypothetical protein
MLREMQPTLLESEITVTRLRPGAHGDEHRKAA